MHRTYQGIKEVDDDLRQGDILFPTLELSEALKEIHPHFCDPKYMGFIVLTQSCDLVRRKGDSCKTRYISIAVIRALQDVLFPLIDQVCRPVVAGVYPEESRENANRLLVRILNQNEQASGVFYLHPCEEIGIGDPSVALLRVSVTLRSEEHYSTLVGARRGRLESSFCAKLGWIVGNLYSRVATEDLDQENIKELTKRFLSFDESGEARTPVWIKQSWIDAARKDGVDLSSLRRENARELIDQHKPRPAKEVCVDGAVDVLARLCEKNAIPTTSDFLTQFKNRLANDAVFSSYFR